MTRRERRAEVVLALGVAAFVVWVATGSAVAAVAMFVLVPAGVALWLVP